MSLPLMGLFAAESIIRIAYGRYIKKDLHIFLAEAGTFRTGGREVDLVWMAAGRAGA